MADTVRIELAVEAVDNTGQVIDKIIGSLEKMKKTAEKSSEPLDKTSKKTTEFDKQIQKTQKTLQGWMKQKWQIALEAKDKITPLLSTLKNGLSTVAGKAWSVTLKAIDLVTSPVKGILNLLKNPILQAGAVLGVTIGLTDTINTYKDFEATMSKVKAISGATTSEMERLTAKAKEMGETTKFTATEAGDAFTYMAMAGWDSQQMLNGIEGIMNLAAADGLDLATTSDIVTDALTAFHLKASDAAHFADVLAKASSSANTNVAMLGSSFKYVGSVAGAFGYSIEDTAIALAAMANAGVKGDMGGTALRGALTSLISPSENAAKVMDKYGLSMEGANGKTKTLMEVIEMLRGKFNGLNVSLFDGEGELKDYETILQEMSGASGDTSASVETLSDLATLFSARALPGMLALIQSGTEDFYALSDAIYHADGTASDMSETMLDNLAGSLTILQSAAEGAKLSVGERLAPYIRRFAEWLTGMMPAIKRGLNEAIDWIEGKIEELKRKIQDVTGSVEFQDADFFGKVEILWDEIIATPFHEWWESKGRRMFADTAGNAAKWIGEGIKNGLLALLGVQLDAKAEEQAAKDAGVSIAASFVNGLKEGLNSGGGIGSAISSIFGNMLSSAGKILPGGAAPGLDTLVSMIALSKIATPVLAVGKGVSAIGKAVTTPTGSDGASLASWVLGSGATGKGLLGLGAKTAAALGAGDPLIGASLSSGAMSAVGLGSIAGGLMGGYSLFSGIKDLHTGFTSEDAEKAAAYKKAGTREVLGVGVGAGLGATIGSAFFGVGAVPGALIGAGIGGIAGMMSGNKAKKEYEEQARVAQEAATKEVAAHELITAKAAYTGQSIQEITFKSRELNKAFEDTETSADTFYTMFREAVNEKIAGSFGDISFSLQEIRDMAKSIVFDSGIADVEKFQESVAKTEKRLSALKADTSALEKLNWQAGVGIQFTEADVSNYREQTDAFVKDAQNYLRDKHYEATIAFKLLTDGNGDLSGVDSVYASLQEELDSKSSELQAKVKIALDDGVIQLDELEEITNLQNQISDIMNRVSAAEESAKLDTLKIKYGGADMDVASFRQLQSDIAEFMKSAEDTDYEAYTIALTNLKLQFPDGGEAYEAAVAELNANLDRRREERLNRTLTIELQTIVENNDLNLDSVWPDLSGDVSTMASRLRELMNSALAVQPDPIQWTEGQVSQWFGLSGLDAVSLSAFTEMIRGVAETLPQTVREQISAANIGGEVAEAATEMIANANEAIATTEGVDMSGALDSIPENAAETARNLDTSPVSEAISDKMTDSINVGMENLGDAEIELSALKDAAETGVNETLGDINVQAGADAMTANARAALTDSMSALDMSGANEALTTVVGGGFTEAMGNLDFTEGTGILTTNVTSSVTEGMSGLDFSAASEAIRIILSAAIAAGISGTDLSAAFAALTELRQALESQAQATLGAQMAIQVPVSLTYNYNVTNPTPPKPTVTAQTYTSNVAAHANGGFVSGAELSWVGEDGPEAIIPLGAKRRGRGLELYKQVGEILGVAKNAEGGVYGVADNSAHAHYDNHYDNRYDNRSVSSVTGGSALSNYDNRSASEITNQFAGASVAYLAPDGLHIIQYPNAGTNTAYDTHDSRTDVSNVTGNSYREANAYDARRFDNSLRKTENNSAETAYDVRDSRTNVSNVTGNPYRTESASVYAPFLSTYNARRSAVSSVLTENNSAETAYDAHNSRTDISSVRLSQGGFSVSNIAGNSYREANAYDARRFDNSLHRSENNSAETAYDVRDSRTDVSNVTGNPYRTESASVYAPSLSTYNARRSAVSSVLTENNSEKTAYDAHNSRTNISSVRLSQGGLSVSNIAGDSYRAGNTSGFLSFLSYDARRSDNSLHRTENNSAETAYDVRDSRTATYLLNETGGVFNTRSGNVYGGSVSLSVPVTNAYDAGTRNAVTVRNVRNPGFRGGDSRFASTVTNIRNSGNRDWREISLTENFPSASGVNNSAASFNSFSPRFTAAYDMRRASNSHSYRAEANAETAYDTRNIHAASQNSVTDISPSTLTAYDIQSNPLSVFNGGDSFARSFLSGPTSIYDARTEEDSFTDMSRTGEASYYNTDSLFRLPEEATAYSALEAPETPFESGTGFYPGDAENGDSGAETAFAPIYDAPADGGGTSGAASRNAPVTINVTLTPSFSFSNTGGESDGKMESFIRRCMKESADDLADELAERLIAVFENSPRR